MANQIKGLDGGSIGPDTSNPIERVKVSGPVNPATPEASSNSRQADSVHVSNSARSLAALAQAVNDTPDVNQVRVSAVQQSLANGSYRVNPERIADRLQQLEQDFRSLEETMSVARQDVQQHLGRILAEESQLLVELHDVLQQETSVLRGDDIEAIQRIGSNRHRCVNGLTRLSAERSETGRMLSFGSDGAGLAKLFDWADPTAKLRGKWSSNLEAARKCKAINDLNGAIVAAKLDRVQKLLGNLRGSTPPPVYSAKGARYGNLSPRDLGRA